MKHWIDCTVFVRNFSCKPSWIPGIVTEKLGHRSWLVKTKPRSSEAPHWHEAAIPEQECCLPSTSPASLVVPMTDEATGRQPSASSTATDDNNTTGQPVTLLAPRPQRHTRPPDRYEIMEQPSKDEARCCVLCLWVMCLCWAYANAHPKNTENGRARTRVVQLVLRSSVVSPYDARITFACVGHRGRAPRGMHARENMGHLMLREREREKHFISNVVRVILDARSGPETGAHGAPFFHLFFGKYNIASFYGCLLKT